MLRERFAALLKWPIYAVLVVACLSASVGLWLGFVWCVIWTARFLQ